MVYKNAFQLKRFNNNFLADDINVFNSSQKLVTVRIVVMGDKGSSMEIKSIKSVNGFTSWEIAVHWFLVYSLVT